MNTQHRPYVQESKSYQRFKKWVASITLVAFLGQPVLAAAEVIADPNAGAKKPTVETTYSGKPIVQITAPTAGGVSHNQYLQFNVDAQGLILNNSRFVTQTQLAGYIQGNPNLARGTARIILNEVTGTGKSYLNGWTEVAGDRADLVIANPNGIVGNGFGFINTSRAVLTTGMPVFGGSGSLEAFRVARGSIQIEGNGLNAADIDRVDLISRAIEVNAGIWAKEINAVTGNNQVDYATLTAVRQAADGNNPAVAIDVSQLGGMYAGKIKLVGTEQGVGVNNQGVLSATGDLVLTQEGKLINDGTAYAKGNGNVSAAEVNNSGVLAAQQNLAVSAQTITSSGVVGAGIQPDGAVGGSGELTLTAAGTVTNQGQALAGGKLTINAGSAIENQNAIIAANNGIELTTGDLDNTGGTIQAASGTAETKIAASGTVNNTRGVISSGNTLDLNDRAQINKTLALTNTDGTVFAGKNLTIDGAALNGTGKILSQGDLTLTLSGDYIHTGEVKADGSAKLKVGGTLTNQSTLLAGNNLTINAQNLVNTAVGEIKSQNTTLTAATLTNRGLINGSQTVLSADTLQNIGTGRIYGDHVAIGAGTLLNDTESSAAPVIAARNRLDIGAQTITNREHATLFSGGDLYLGGSLDANRQARGQAGTVNNNSATIEALGNAELTARQINNTNEHFSTYMKVMSTENIEEYQGSGSPNRYLKGTPGVNTYKDESLHLHTPEGNYKSWLLYSYTRTVTESKVLTTDPGQILSGGAMRITADTLTNDKSKIVAGSAFSGTIGNLINTEVAGQHVITDSGKVTNYWRKKKPGKDTTGSSSSGYYPAATVQAITLTPTVYQENTAPAGSGTQVGSQNAITQVTTPAGTVVRSGAVAASVPNSSLYHVNPDITAHYLVETDPKFADYKTWLSSDYMIKSLALEPSVIEKRMGDGFYEQQLIRQQVTELTGQRRLDGYTSDEEEYKALMDNAAVFAKQHNLTVGVALTPEQMALLTTDIVWLVDKEVTLPDGSVTHALVPQVYVRSLKDGDLTTSGALIAGNNVQLGLDGDITNKGTISGRNIVALTAENLQNLGGKLEGKNITVQTRQDINNIGGQIKAKDSLTLDAGRDLNVTSTTTTQTNQQGSRTNIDRVAGLYVTGENGILLASADRDVNLIAASIGSSGKNGTTTIQAGNNLNLGTVTEGDSNHLVWDSKNQRSDSSRAEIGTSITTQGNLALKAGKDVNARAANVESTQGALTVAAGKDVNLTAGTANQSVDESHVHKGSSGMFSSSTYSTRDVRNETTAQSTTLSGNTVDIQAGKDIQVKGSNVVGTQDVNMTAKNDVAITTAEHTLNEEHMQQRKSSGLLGGGGLGFTIGTRSEKTTLNEQTVAQAGSTIGSTAGSVNITAGNNLNSQGATLISGKDINLTGKGVTLDNSVDTYDSQYKYEFKQSGLSVSLGGALVDGVTGAVNSIQRAGEVKDSRLQALYDYKAVEDLQHAQKALNKAGGKLNNAVDVNISIGSSQSTMEQTTHAETVNSSNVTAGGNVKVTATENDINLKGTNVTATDITLDAKNNINLEAAANKQTVDSKTSSSSWSVGGTIGGGFFGNASQGSGKENGTVINYTGSDINASGTLTIKSGQDTNIIGSKAEGKKVSADIGGNLNIASLQSVDDYKASSQSAGIGFGTGKISGTHGSIGTSKTNSTYDSVTDQAGIYAGKEGFDINVGKNTDLKGAVISSEASPEKNKLSTDTLTYSDIQNKAQYSASSQGVNYAAGKDANGNPIKYNASGLTPNIGVTISGESSSTTKSAISPGSIEIRSNPNQDISGLSRDTTNALNSLGKIFDKKTVQEKQELASLFGEIAFEEIHKLSDKNGWDDGSPQKIALHSLIGGIMSELAGGGFASGAVGAGINEAVQKELQKLYKDQPDVWQWASYVIGAAAAKAVGGDAQTGGSSAASGTKNNSQLLPPVEWALKALGFTVTLYMGFQIIKDKAGKTVASWSKEKNGWVDSAENWIGDNWNSIVLWAKGESTSQAVDNVLKDATPGRETKGKTTQYEKSGGYEQAVNDFDSLGVENVKEIEGGKVGQLPDGRSVNVRVDSSDGRPTLEIMNKNGTRTKVRYNE